MMNAGQPYVTFARQPLPNYAQNVVLRRKPAHTLSREEIMNQVTEFCRKSMNRTPTKLMAGSSEQMSSEVSPISYTSMDSKTSPSIASSRSAKIAPQVPLRVQSLQSNASDKSADHPIYEPIFKRGSTHSETTTAMMLASASSPTHNKRVSFAQKRQQQQQQQQRTCSETDSAFVSDENTPTNGHYQVPKRYVVMDSEMVTPTHVMKFQTAAALAAKQSSPLAIQATHHSPYGYIQYRDGTNPPPCSPQIFYQPTLLQSTPQQKLRIGVDGRTTPILLQQPHSTSIATNLSQAKSSGGRIVVLDNAEQFYRPIASTSNSRVRLVSRNGAYPIVGKQINYVRSGNQIIPYECDTVNANCINENRRGQHRCNGKCFQIVVLFFCFFLF